MSDKTKNYMPKDLVSIIITTKNSAGTLKAFLQSIKNQSYKNIEIILVDNFSTDKTLDLAKSFTKKVYSKGPERSAQRNFGVSKAAGKYVFILDSDMELQKNVVSDCILKIQKDQNLGALIVPEKSFGKGFWTQCKAFERSFYIGDDNIEAARFFKKTLFKKFKGYDFAITGPEDWDLPLRMREAGVKIGRVRSYILHNEGKVSLFKLMKKKFYYGSHASTYLLKHPNMAVSQGNMLFRPAFFRGWKRLITNPTLTMGLFFMRFWEMSAALVGFLVGLQRQRS